MSDLTDYAENLLANFLLNTETASRPTAWYVALHTADPGETGATAELSGNGYARQQTTFGAASGGQVANTAAETFGPNTTVDWGTVTHVSIWDSLTNGNCLAKSALANSRAVAVDDTVTLAIGDATFAMA